MLYDCVTGLVRNGVQWETGFRPPWSSRALIGCPVSFWRGFWQPREISMIFWPIGMENRKQISWQRPRRWRWCRICLLFSAFIILRPPQNESNVWHAVKWHLKIFKACCKWKWRIKMILLNFSRRPHDLRLFFCLFINLTALETTTGQLSSLNLTHARSYVILMLTNLYK